MAASAIIVVGAELNQQAVIATYDFPRVNWGKGRGHRVVGVPELATPYFLEPILGERFRLQLTIWGQWPVQVKGKMQMSRTKTEIISICAEQNRKYTVKPVSDNGKTRQIDDQSRSSVVFTN
jgi:hypothetical protein